MSAAPTKEMLQILGAMSIAGLDYQQAFKETCARIRSAAHTPVEPEIGRLAAMYVALELGQESSEESA